MRGKKPTAELDELRYYLESNLRALHCELHAGTYRHGGYRSFLVNDTKPRQIAVASVKDRFVHRLLYEYLVELYDKTFIGDVWSCRTGKGLLGAIERAQVFLQKHRHDWFWRADIHKFFDSVDQNILAALLERKVPQPKTMRLLHEVIASYNIKSGVWKNERERERESLSKRAAFPLAMSPVRSLPIFISMNWTGS